MIRDHVRNHSTGNLTKVSVEWLADTADLIERLALQADISEAVTRGLRPQGPGEAV